MNQIRLLGLGVVFILLSFVPCCQADVLLYGGSSSPFQLYEIDSATGQSNPIGTSSFIPGFDLRANGVLYGSSSTLKTINPATGASTTIATLPELVVSIAFSPSDTLYGVNNEGTTLYELNPATGASLRSVPITGTVHSFGSAFPGEINGIDFAPDGTLIGAGFGLYSIDPLTGVATRITPLGQNVTGTLLLDLDIDFTGEIRALEATEISVLSSLLRIDRTTGLGTVLGSTGVAMRGLASIAVPEPASIGLVGVSWMALVFGRRLK